MPQPHPIVHPSPTLTMSRQMSTVPIPPPTVLQNPPNQQSRIIVAPPQMTGSIAHPPVNRTDSRTIIGPVQPPTNSRIMMPPNNQPPIPPPVPVQIAVQPPPVQLPTPAQLPPPNNPIIPQAEIMKPPPVPPAALQSSIRRDVHPQPQPPPPMPPANVANVMKSTVRKDVPPPPSQLVKNPSSRMNLKVPPAPFQDGHSSGEESVEISNPNQVHVFKEVAVQFDKTTGLVILPKDYLKMRHKMTPVKAEYKPIKKAGWKNYFLKDVWEVTATGELRCINEEMLKQQHGVMSYVLKKFAKNLLTGKSILNVSLPVSIFSEL